MSTFFKSGSGGSVESWKDPVADVASLPAMGNIAGDIRQVLDTGDLHRWDGANWILFYDNGASINYVIGPASAADDRIATFDGTTGKLIQDGGQTIAEVIADAVSQSGDVIGPISSDDNAIARYDSTSGELLLNSTTHLADDGSARLGSNSAPAASAILDLSSTTKGLLPPVMNTTQRDAISSPATGLQIYNTTDGTISYYNGTNWINLPTSSSGLGITSAKSADYTITDGDGIFAVLMTTGATDRTVTLPTAADNANRIIQIKKVDTGIGTLTVDGEGAETIDGDTTKLLVFPNESITVVCDGTSWEVESRFFGDSVTEAWTDNQANATTSVRLFRSGPLLKGIGEVRYTGAQSGALAITIPSKYTINNSIYTNLSADWTPVGRANLFTSSRFDGVVVAQSTTTLSVQTLNATVTNILYNDISATNPGTWSSGDKILFNFEWEVEGWS